ncbi:MAG: M23 family metallopeptidase [Clostridiales bacterium]|jgi:murein DD-endopeptidase MepM/ murein hydrolase activator NlpD|nr:M23 family metallopeptidase [Clostridiales bacterium]
MFVSISKKVIIYVFFIGLALFGGWGIYWYTHIPPILHQELSDVYPEGNAPAPTPTADYIHWAEFDVTESMMNKAFEYDLKTYGSDNHVSWIDLLAYSVAKKWGNVNKKTSSYIDEAITHIKSGAKIEDISSNLKYFALYKKIYSAVLSEYVGTYTNADGIEKYGIKAYSPIAKGYSYRHYDDFGNSRSYGYSRRHLGNDLLGSVGTPIIAVEGGTIEALGWNQYGGWRIGIRSHDKQRYYYYAHLRAKKPYAEGLNQGDTVTAGQLIGYLGQSGYSSKEGSNNIKTPHLHFGIQLIFDESQKDSTNQIWIDAYNIIEFLERNRAKVTNNS